jgi:diguanylate cyclase (GGDEF)-like protein/PAS domain S-box-containing protein
MADGAPGGLADVVQRVLRQEAALFQITSLAYQPFEVRLRELVRVDAFTLGVARVSFWVLQQEPESIRCEALFLLPQDRYEAGTVLTARDYPRYFAALRAGLSIPAENAHTDSRTSEFYALYLEPNGIGAMLDIPVFLGGELYGVLCHEHVGRARTWTRDEQLFAMSVGQSIALSIEADRRDQSERALRAGERRMRAMLEASPVPMVVSSVADGLVLYANAALSTLTGVPADQIAGRRTPEFYADPSEREQVMGELARDGRIHGREVRLKRADGSAYWAMVSSVLTELDDNSVLVTSIWDVTAKRETEDRLRRAALYDDLTGLPNRVLLFDLLRAELAKADRHDQDLAVLYLDLDDFKQVNDRFGHEGGDALLRSVADRIRHSLRAGDVPARVGGDEFVALLPNIAGVEGARSVAERISAALAESHAIAGTALSCSVSVGVLMVEKSHQDPSAVLRDADAAMYAAKQAGKSRARVFESRSQDHL